MTSQIVQLKNKIKSLNAKEFKEISDYVYYLEQSKKKTNTVDDSLLYDVIAKHLSRAIKAPIVPYIVFKKTSHNTSYMKCKKYLDSYIVETGIPLTRQNKLKFYSLYSDLMADYITTGPAPLSVVTMIKQHDRFPGVLDNSFPGYFNSVNTRKLLMKSLQF